MRALSKLIMVALVASPASGCVSKPKECEPQTSGWHANCPASLLEDYNLHLHDASAWVDAALIVRMNFSLSARTSLDVLALSARGGPLEENTTLALHDSSRLPHRIESGETWHVSLASASRFPGNASGFSYALRLAYADGADEERKHEFSLYQRCLTLEGSDLAFRSSIQVRNETVDCLSADYLVAGRVSRVAGVIHRFAGEAHAFPVPDNVAFWQSVWPVPRISPPAVG